MLLIDRGYYNPTGCSFRSLRPLSPYVNCIPHGMWYSATPDLWLPSLHKGSHCIMTGTDFVAHGVGDEVVVSDWL